MNYLENFRDFIFKIIEYYSKNYMKYQPEINKKYKDYLPVNYLTIDVDNLMYIFEDLSEVDDFIKENGVPSIKDYTLIVDQIFEVKYWYLNDGLSHLTVENVLKDYAQIISYDLIIEYNEMRMDNICYQREQAILTIQRNYKKYRYDPQYKFCHYMETKNLKLLEEEYNK